jgi:hypothetical protein
MNEDAIRALVRELIARHLATAATPAASPVPHHAPAARPLPLAWHSSHARYAVSSGEESEGPCFIEPAVRCNHCGYCQSHGH